MYREANALKARLISKRRAQVRDRRVHNCILESSSISRANVYSNIRLYPDSLNRSAIRKILNPPRYRVLPAVSQRSLFRVGRSAAGKISYQRDVRKNIERKDHALGTANRASIR